MGVKEPSLYSVTFICGSLLCWDTRQQANSSNNHHHQQQNEENSPSNKCILPALLAPHFPLILLAKLRTSQILPQLLWHIKRHNKQHHSCHNSNAFAKKYNIIPHTILLLAPCCLKVLYVKN